MCEYYGIELNHHQADSDSMAVARILLWYMKGGAQPGRFVKKYRFRSTGSGSKDVGSDRRNAVTKHIEMRLEDFALET